MTINSMDLYEQKILSDKEFPIQLQINQVSKKGWYFAKHWHEHLELHYIIKGSTTIQLNQKDIRAEKGSLVIANSNELHAGYCDGNAMDAIVVIFEMEELSRELAEKNIIFQSLIQEDEVIRGIFMKFWTENEHKELGYKLACKGALLELITYLSRNYALEMLSESDSLKRKRKLERLNTVIQYIQEHYAEPVSNHTLAEVVHLSEDRFNHLFKESMGMAPLQYINEVRLKKAMHLLKKGEFTIAQVASSVGVADYNHFGRMFRRYYGCTPLDAVQQKSDERDT